MLFGRRLLAQVTRRYDVYDEAGMRIRAEYRSGALYIYFGERRASRTDVISESQYIADFDEGGQIAGLEVLEPWNDLPWQELAQRCGFARSLKAVQAAAQQARNGR